MLLKIKSKLLFLMTISKIVKKSEIVLRRRLTCFNAEPLSRLWLSPIYIFLAILVTNLAFNWCIFVLFVCSIWCEMPTMTLYWLPIMQSIYWIEVIDLFTFIRWLWKVRLFRSAIVFCNLLLFISISKYQHLWKMLVHGINSFTTHTKKNPLITCSTWKRFHRIATY